MKGLLSIRFLFACMAFLGVALMQMMRFNISVAMTVMAGRSHQNTPSDITQSKMNASQYTSYDDNAYIQVDGGNSSESKEWDKVEPEFNWDSHTQELLLSAFYVGYTLGNIPSGWLADKLGGKWLIFGGICGSAVFNTIGPLAARSGVEFFFVTRCMAGIAEGFILPAIATMVNKWSPVNERTRMMTFIIAGFAFGPAVGQSLSGLMCAHHGWPATFYLFGGLNLTWAFFWAVTSSEDPLDHPLITRKERTYIAATRSQRVEKVQIPTRSILLSLPAIAFAVVLFAIPGFVYFNLACNLPIYFKYVLGYDILSVGFLTSIPYICQWAASLIASYLADSLIGQNILSRTKVRKLTIASGSFLMVVCLFLISFGVGNNATVIVIHMAVMYGAMGVVFSAVFVNALDIAPCYSGTIAGIGNAIAVTSGFIGPLVTAVFTEDQADPMGWRTVFIITAVVTVAGALFFQVFGSGEVQPWALVDMVDENQNETEKSLPLTTIKEPADEKAV